MAARCTICFHRDRAHIDAALLERVPLSRLAREYGVSTSALHRHNRHHLAGPMAEAAAARRRETVRLGSDLLTKVSEIEDRARRILDAAEAAGSLPGQLGALRELWETVRLLGQVTQQLNTGPMTINNFILTPQWTLLKTTIAAALKQHPDALRDVLAALRSLNVETSSTPENTPALPVLSKEVLRDE